MNTFTVTIISISLIFYLLNFSYHSYYTLEIANSYMQNKKNLYLLHSGYDLGINFLKTNELEINKALEKQYVFDKEKTLKLYFLKISKDTVKICGNLFVNSCLAMSYSSLLDLQDYKYIKWVINI